jgi:hypothetical protein
MGGKKSGPGGPADRPTSRHRVVLIRYDADSGRYVVSPGRRAGVPRPALHETEAVNTGQECAPATEGGDRGRPAVPDGGGPVCG